MLIQAYAGFVVQPYGDHNLAIAFPLWPFLADTLTTLIK